MQLHCLYNPWLTKCPLSRHTSTLLQQNADLRIQGNPQGFPSQEGGEVPKHFIVESGANVALFDGGFIELFHETLENYFVEPKLPQ